MPAITNDAPPMNEAIHDGVNGLLVGLDVRTGPRGPGSRRSTPTSASCGGAIERLADDSLRAELAAGALRVRDTERRWSGDRERDRRMLETASNG